MNWYRYAGCSHELVQGVLFIGTGVRRVQEVVSHPCACG